MQEGFYTILDQLGILAISGPDAKKLLQGQLTSNLDDLQANSYLMGAHCNPQGRILSLFYLFQLQDHYYLQMPKTLIPFALAALKKYAVFFKVNLYDASPDFFCLGLGGKLLTLPDTLVTMPLSGPLQRYQLIGKASQKNLWLQTIANDMIEIPYSQWKANDITAGLPTLYPETIEKFLPHDLNLQHLNAISFTKGCYTGQEIIARMQYKGKIKTHLYTAKVQTNQPLILGQDLYNDQGPAGHIVDFAEVGYNNYVLLITAKESDMANALYVDETKKIILEK